MTNKPKFCKDCKHFDQGGLYLSSFFCKRPTGEYNLINGIERPATSALNEREKDHLCGKEARYFTPKDAA
jgi:hypothetical protein